MGKRESQIMNKRRNDNNNLHGIIITGSSTPKRGRTFTSVAWGKMPLLLAVWSASKLPARTSILKWTTLKIGLEVRETVNLPKTKRGGLRDA